MEDLDPTTDISQERAFALAADPRIGLVVCWWLVFNFLLNEREQWQL